ncbi:PilZ domain-containing protein [Qipengyuania flava]|uniref:PilZ domain-containing protein n=1 Tax=Qipengyuania TaxID=1855416 RepID=UPI001C869C6A|nr:PilZ domain-containing protein [Qipengyuania aestuarii]MBX7536392.1 PilZ domain-containing protein [Qipengyuania aestuarii]MCA0979104.1 PilZ domain-containing protein [Qipengyuania flava]
MMPDTDLRNEKRDSVLMMAQLTVEGAGASERVKIRNLSNSGIQVEGPVLAGEGQRAVVSIRQIGDVGGTVTWTRSARIGIRFDEPIKADAARTSLVGDMPEAPRYARAAITPRESYGKPRSV